MTHTRRPAATSSASRIIGRSPIPKRGRTAPCAIDDARTLRSGDRTDALTAPAAERTFANADETLTATEGQISADQMMLFLALGRRMGG